MKGYKRVRITLNQRYDTDIIILLTYLDCPLVDLVNQVIEAYRNDNGDGSECSIPLTRTPKAPVGRIVSLHIPDNYIVPGNYKAAEWIKLLIRTYAKLPKPYLLMEPWVDEKSFSEARSEKTEGLSAADRVVEPKKAAAQTVNEVISQAPSAQVNNPTVRTEVEVPVKRHKPLTSAIEEKEVSSTVSAPEVNASQKQNNEGIYDSGEVDDADILSQNASAFLDALAG